MCSYFLDGNIVSTVNGDVSDDIKLTLSYNPVFLNLRSWDS